MECARRIFWLAIRALALTISICAINTAVGLAADGEAAPRYESTVPPAIRPAYEPADSPSGNIIGYQPIPDSALNVPSPATAGQPSLTALTGPAPQSSINGQPTTPQESQLPVEYQTGIMLGEGTYTLGRDDVIRIAVRNQPDFSGDFVIGYDGRIQYNYLGDLPIAGLTKYEVQQVLEKLLERYIRVPVVSIQILAYNSKVVYVIGEVNRPGKFIMRGDAIKLREAILAAGLTTSRAALSRVHVIKPDLNKPIVRRINLKRILYTGKLKDDVDLASGEIVVVPSTVWSKVNDFLSALLSPATRIATRAALLAM